jgi:hypothetical protein
MQLEAHNETTTSGERITKIMTDDAEVKELHPFSLNFDATAGLGIQDFRPKAVMVDPKESAVAHSEGQEKEPIEAIEIPEGNQETLPLMETEPNPSTEQTTEPEIEPDLPPLPPELTERKITKPSPKSITTPSAH